MNLLIQESACNYLFGKSASEIFAESTVFSNTESKKKSKHKVTEKSEIEKIVNQSLETLMNVNIAFLSRKENNGFPLIDPAAFNNQCHLYALFAAKSMEGYQEKSKEEKEAKTQENRFLHLSFILSYTFLKERQLLCRAIEAAAKKKEVAILPDPKLFYQLIKDPGGILIRTGRQSLNELFEGQMKKILADKQMSSPLHRELYLLSLEDLRLQDERGSSTLYTFPKLAGVAYLIHENFAFVMKTKVITKEGTAALFYQSRSVKEDEPVCVFETIASNLFSIEEFRKTAESCPSFHERSLNRKKRHSEKATCLFCNSGKVDNLQLYQESFDKTIQCTQEMFYALGTDFVRECQAPFLHFFNNEDKYPLLTSIFQQSIPRIEQLGLSMKKPLTFTIEHVYVDSGKYASSPNLIMNFSPEAFLTERGFL